MHLVAGDARDIEKPPPQQHSEGAGPELQSQQYDDYPHFSVTRP